MGKSEKSERPAGPPRLGRWVVVLAGACLVGLLVCTVRQPQAPEPGPFTVMTYNVNYDMPRADETVAAIRNADADLVCLQETTPQWESLLRRELGGRYRHMRFRHLAGAGGQAFLSKFRFGEVFYRRPEGAWHPAWLIRADTPAGAVQVLNLHLRPPVAQGDDGVYRFGVRAYFDSKKVRRAHAEELLGLMDLTVPTVVLGDLNEGDRGAAVSYMCNDKGLRRALAEHGPHTRTWQVGRGIFSVGQRLDHILHSSHLRCLDARVILEGGSDHRAVVAKFEKADPATSR